MESLLDNPLFSDIKIRGNDGKEISAHRNILVVRSEVFKRMLLSEMKESTQDVIEFPEFSSNTLRIILEYLYTEKVTLAIEIVAEVFHCSDYFLLDQLKLQIIEFIKHYDAKDKINIFSKILSQLLEYMESTNNGLVDLLCNSIRSVPLKSIEYSNLNSKALEYILSKTIKEETNTFSTLEYDIFHYIILWAANGISEEALSFYKSYLPSSEFVKSLNTTHMHFDTPNIQESHANYQSAMTKTSSLFNYVNLERIHPFIISNAIESLNGLIDSKTLTDIYRKQALLAGKYADYLSYINDILFQWDDHARGSSMYLDKTSLIVDSKSSHEWIRTKVPVNIHKSGCGHGQGLVEWNIIVEKLCCQFWVGICTIKGFNVNYNSWLGMQSYGWVFGSGGFICHNTPHSGSGSDANRYGKSFKENDIITVHLNMKEKTCFFSINGVRYPVAFRDLPDEIYPAVSLCSPGRARIEHRKPL